MRLEQLKYFETLVQEGSYTKAAEQLHISQPSLTASIKAMEKELDTPLLIRDTRNFVLTEEGKQVLAFAKETLIAYHALLHQLKPESSQVNGTISIVVSKFFCELILEKFLQTLQTRFPKIKVRPIEHEYHATPQYLSAINHKFAVITRIQAEQKELCGPGILVTDNVFYDSRYQYIPLFTDIFGFCTAKASMLSSIPTIYPATIDYTQYQSTTFPFGTEIFTENIMLSSNNPQLHKEAMLKENAFCNIPYFVYQHFFAQEEALTYRAYSNHMTITYYLIYPADHNMTTAEQLFIEELQNYLTQQKLK